MKERSWFISLGIIIYIILTGVDRIACKVSDYVYIPIVIIEFIKDKNK